MANLWTELGTRVRHMLGGEQKTARRNSSASGRLPMSGGGGGGLFGGGNWLTLNLWRPTRTDFAREVGNPAKNSAVNACLQTILTCWPQAAPKVMRSVADGTKEEEEHHLTGLIDRPSPWYDGRLLMQALLLDYYGSSRRGNAYAYIVLGPDGKPAELQYLPAACVTPRGNETALITHYEYRPSGGAPRDIDPSLVLHWRNGMDPADPKYGIDPLDAVLPEIATDNEAVAWQFGLLKRGGVPAWLLTPQGSDDTGPFMIDPDDAKEMRQSLHEALNGEERGGGRVLTAPMKFERLGIEPRNMVMRQTQQSGEERIAAAFGIPPVVAGLGAGLERSTFSNYEQARAQAWEDCIIPLQDSWAAELNAKLWPLYGEEKAGLSLIWDRANVRCLQDDESQAATDSVALYAAGIIDRASAKRRVGEIAEDADKGLYANANATTNGTGNGQDNAGKGWRPPFVLAPAGATP